MNMWMCITTNSEGMLIMAYGPDGTYQIFKTEAEAIAYKNKLIRQGHNEDICVVQIKVMLGWK